MKRMIPAGLLIPACLGLSSAFAQITGTNTQSAFIYQDSVPSGFAQVLADDTNVNRGLSPQNPPPLSYSVDTRQGSIFPTVIGPVGQIMRWALWGQQKGSGQWYQLDLKALVPITENLSLFSTDFLNPHRTRVGKTYTVSIQIAGLPTAGTGATEAGEIYLGLSALVDGTAYGFRRLAGYAETPSPPINNPDQPGDLPEYHYNAWFLNNGPYSIAGLAPDQPGTEVWLIDWIQTSLSSSTQIDQSSVLVLAAPSALTNQTVPPIYLGDPASLPNLDLAFLNLYPGSLTLFQLLDSQNHLLANLTVSDDTSNPTGIVAHQVPHFPMKLSSYITQEGLYTFKAWTAEPFVDGLPSILGGDSAPIGYTWTPLPLLGLDTLSVQFSARVQGTIITD